MARLQIEAGQDPLRLLNLAEKDISQALRRKPNAEAHNIRGTCQLLRGEWWDKNAQKEQAVVATRSAAREMQRSVQINPRYLDSWHKLGLASFLLAGFAADANEDPGPHFTRARESYLKMLGVQPNNPTALLGLGHAFSNEAALLLRKGQPESARPKLEAAIRRYEQAKACSDQQTSLTAQKRLAELRTWQVRQR